MTSAFQTKSFPPPCPIAGLGAAAAAAATGVPLAAIHAPRRSRQRVAQARQLAIYLHHVTMGDSVSSCARHFARDRTTIRYACARIEDLRENPAFDRCARRLERAVVAQRDMVRALIAETSGVA